jgi:hypothetical protein
MAHLSVRQRLPLRNSFIPSRRHSLQLGPVYLAILPPYTLRRLGGRQPLWGMGVTSRMAVISSPAACKDLIAASRPAPGPLTHTSIRFIPCSMASRAADWAAICAAKGVDFLEPLKPDLPAVAHDTTLPLVSEIEIIVLLKVDLIWATPTDSVLCPFRFPFFLLVTCCSANYSILILTFDYSAALAFLPIVFLGPFRVRELVLVR